MEVKPGYKLTEIGQIPVDWEAERLLAVADCLDFLRVPLNEAQRQKMQGDIPYCGANGVLDFVNDFVVDDDIILMAEDGGYFDEYASRPIAYRMSGKSWVNNHAHILKAKTGADQGFLFYSLVHKNILPFLASGTRAKLNKSEMAKILVPSPSSTSEQSAIATALSDVDALLAAQDALIAKKRAIKQGAMQELLTGKRRLPGFGGEWEVKTLNQFAEIGAGINKPLSEMGSGSLYVTVQDLYEGNSIRTDRLSRIKVSEAEIEAKGLSVGDIVFGKSSVKREGIGYPSIFLGCAEPVVFSGFTYRARARSCIADAGFLFYALRSSRTRRWLIDNSQASALTNINQFIADAIPIWAPPTITEQSAIAAVLSDIEAEITALESQRAKTAQLKQGMMQALLTGRIRLV